MLMKITEIQKQELCQLYVEGYTNQQLSDKYGISLGYVYLILRYNKISIRNRITSTLKKGDVYFKWTILGEPFVKKYSQPSVQTTQILCRCECGSEKIVPIRCNKPVSRMCLDCYHKNGNSTHGQSRTKLYRTFHAMKDRCYNPNNYSYKIYGGKGIKICDEWNNDFFAFKEWAENNGHQDGLSIERRDPRLNYCPENCEWISKSENSIRANEFKDKLIQELLVENQRLKDLLSLKT